jgi:putative aminopeptidase FrvX
VNQEDIDLIKTLCSIHAPSGNEVLMKEFLLKYIKENSKKWSATPRVKAGEEIQDCIIATFGEPRVAVFVHMDSIGFMARYNNELIPIGGPDVEDGFVLIGKDSKGKIEGKLIVDNENRKLMLDFKREVDRGTELVFKPVFKETDDDIQCCYLDNRLGLYVVLKLMETAKNACFVFSCWEEHGGGSVSYLAKYIYKKHKINKALICDITWITEGVLPGEGVVISLRDKSIPRRSFVNKIIETAKESGVKFQVEVEGSGGSDGKELQASPYPFDWCFIGAAEENVHSPMEKVNKEDIKSMIELYMVLLERL